MRSADEVAQLFQDRLKASSPLLEMMRQVRDQVNGDVLVPLPEMEASQKPAVANIVAGAIEQTSMRVASTMPHITVPPLNPRNQDSLDRAKKAEGALRGYMRASRIKQKVNRRRARYMTAYGQSAV